MADARAPVTPADVCAVVVAFNPDDSSIEALRTIFDSAARTVVVDNGSRESTAKKLQPWLSPQVEVVENAANTGVAAALNQGIRLAWERGYRWFLLFDQDTRIFPNSIATVTTALNDCLAESGAKVGLLGSNFFPSRADGSVGEARVPYCQQRTWGVQDMMITSGTIIGWDSFTAVGPFSEELFVDHVDHEYCLRARRKGFLVARAALPSMVHRMGMVNLKHVGWGSKIRLISNYGPLRRYYQIRNMLLIAREYGDEFPESIAWLRETAKAEISRALKYEGGRVKKIAAIILAHRHARRGISGPYRGRLFATR